jgi:hypothetical protein
VLQAIRSLTTTTSPTVIKALDTTESPMAEQTIHVGLGDYQVALRTDVPEVIATVTRSFREMLVCKTASAVARLEAHWNCGHYRLEGIGEPARPLTSKTLFIKHVFTELRQKFINYHSSLLWIHAGAAGHGGRAVLIVGPGGRGKSTLVTGLCATGWTYLSDDITPVDSSSDQAFPFPIAPAVREDAGCEMPLEWLSDIRKIDVEILPEAVCRQPMSLGALVFPSYSHSSPCKLARCSPASAALELLGNCLNLAIHREAAVGYFCDLVKRLPAFRLTYKSASLATELIAQAHDNWDCID